MSLNDHPPKPLGEAKRKKKSGLLPAELRRATSFLRPYWRMVAISIFCALFVGVAFAGGITSMLPIMRVLLNGDTLAGWADRQIAAERLDVGFNDDSADLRIVRIGHKSPLTPLGFKPADMIVLSDAADSGMAGTLSKIADPAVTAITLKTPAGAAAPVTLPAVKPTHAVLRTVTQHAPRGPVAAVACVFGVIGLIVTVGGVIRFFQEYLSDKAAIMAISTQMARA